MFVSFSVAAFLFWAFIASFLPGAVISFALFRKDAFNLLEKLFIGFAIGMVSLPLIPFVLYLVLGIKFSFAIALLSVTVLYAIAIALFVKNRAYEEIKIPAEGLSFKLPGRQDLREAVDYIKPAALVGVNAFIVDISTYLARKVKPATLTSAALLIILALTYLVRVGSYSPVFQELDPYYYTYVASQILTFGYNPENDQTSWYPDLVVDHREIPEISYLESVWYALYTGGAPYDNMLMALVASMYPPIAAVLAVFFIYLLVSVASRREWGVAAAGIATFIPVFIYKLAAGEQEVQPYAFFALLFFYAMYALAVSRKDARFAVLAGLSFAAVALGSSSQSLALSAVMVFVAVQAILLYIRDDDASGLRQLLVTNGIVFAIGPLLGSAILRDVFSNGAPTFTVSGAFLMCLAFAAVLYVLKRKLPGKGECIMALAAIAVLGIILFAFTPLADPIKGVARGGFEIANYNAPLDRTIAEQGGASTTFDGQMGVIASVFEPPAAGVQNPITKLSAYLFWVLVAPFTLLANGLLILSVSSLNLLLGTDVAIDAKANSVMFFWIIAFIGSLAWGLWKFTRKEDTPFLLFLAIVLPPFIIGIIKAKYTIYAAVLLAVAIGFSLEPLSRFVAMLLEWLGSQGVGSQSASGTGKGAASRAAAERKGLAGTGGHAGIEGQAGGGDAADREAAKSMGYYTMLLVAGVLIILQFTYANFAPALALHSLQPLYQNDPAALAPKFTQFCAATNDSDLCAAAADPMGYASRGTNYQYSYKLCVASVYSNVSYVSNPGAAPYESQAAYFRCQRVADYWINSMEWLRDSTPNGSRIVSWWDYGHWINYFGQRNAVIRNEHLSHQMIGDVAHAYVDGGPDVLSSYMKSHDIKYALFDMELIYGGGQLGGKFGALNYLSCARDNDTTVANPTGASKCESDHLWESVFVSNNPCTISSLSNKTGFTAYEMYQDVYKAGADGRPVFAGTFYVPYYPSDCASPTDPNVVAYCKNLVRAVPTYCVGEVTLASGQQTYGTYYLNQTYPNGDLRLNKALLQMPYQLQNTYHFGPATAFTLFYTEDAIWLENGEVKSGYEDRKGRFYSSNLYRAMFLNDIPGFRLDYTTPDGMVKIYEISG